MNDHVHYRAPMRSRLPGVDPWAGVERGIELGVCGIGGRLPAPPASLAEAIELTATVHDLRAARRLARFAEVATGATVWTRDGAGGFHVGTLDGPWRYDGRPSAHAADLVHVRSCSWVEVGVAEVPEPVRTSFSRGGLNFQRVRALGQ